MTSRGPHRFDPPMDIMYLSIMIVSDGIFLKTFNIIDMYDRGYNPGAHSCLLAIGGTPMIREVRIGLITIVLVLILTSFSQVISFSEDGPDEVEAADTPTRGQQFYLDGSFNLAPSWNEEQMMVVVKQMNMFHQCRWSTFEDRYQGYPL